MVSGKIELLLSLKERFKTSLSSAKDKLGNGIKDMKSQITSLKEHHVKAFSAMKDEIPGFGRAVELITNPYLLATAAVLALGAATVKAVSSAMTYETGMAKINSTAKLTKEQLGGLRNQLLDIGKDSGGNFEKIPESFEKILSQVGDVDTSLTILKASVQGAKAGFTDLDVVSGAIAQSLSVIGKENANAQDVLDTFFAAKRVGAGEFKDFATYLPTLIAAGKNLGIQYKDVAGIFAYMTAKGQDASSATMLMENAFTALSKSEIVKGLKGAGINVFDKTGTMRDMGDIMGELKGHLDKLGNDQARSNFLEKIGLRDAQAKNAFSILTSDAKLLKDTLGQVNNSAGETADALKNTDSPMRTWAELSDLVNYAFTKIGYVLLPYVGAALRWIVDGIKTAADWFSTLYNNSEIFRDSVANIFGSLKVAWYVLGAAFEVIKTQFIMIGNAIQGVYEWLGGKGNIFAIMFEGAEKSYFVVKSLFMEIITLAQIAFDGLNKFLRGDRSGAVESLKAFREQFSNLGQTNYAEEFEKRKLLKSENQESLIPQGTSNSTNGPAAIGNGKQASEELNKVTGESKSVRNATISIGALQKGDINVSSQTTNGMSMQQLEKYIQELFLRTVRNVEASY